MTAKKEQLKLKTNKKIILKTHTPKRGLLAKKFSHF